MELTRTASQLEAVFGPTEGQKILAECLGENELIAIETAQQLMRVAQSLIKRGGFVEVVGRALKVQALLGGARIEIAR